MPFTPGISSFPRLRRGQVKANGFPRIDFNHPLAAGLLFYGFDTGCGVIIDLVRFRPFSSFKAGPVSETPTSSSSQWGAGFKWDADVHIGVFQSDPEIRNATAAGYFSWACAYNMTSSLHSAGINYGRPFGRTANSGASPFLNWDFEINPGGIGDNNIFVNVLKIGGTQQIASITTNTLNAYHSLLAAVTGGPGANAASAAGYFDGQVAGTASGFTINNQNTPSDAICFSGDGGLITINGGFFGNIFYGAFWGRTLGASEALQMHLDPYCFLVPQFNILVPQTIPLSLQPGQRVL